MLHVFIVFALLFSFSYLEICYEFRAYLEFKSIEMRVHNKEHVLNVSHDTSLFLQTKLDSKYSSHKVHRSLLTSARLYSMPQRQHARAVPTSMPVFLVVP